MTDPVPSRVDPPEALARPAIAVVVVSYNTCALLRRCLASLAHSTLPLHVVVVDNASSDDSAEMVAREFPAVELIVSADNVGFAGANNLALRRLLNDPPGWEADKRARPDYILLLNPDAELTRGSLETLVAFLQRHPRVALAAPRLRYPDGAHQAAAFRFPTLLMSLFDFFPPRGPLLGRLYSSPLNGRYPQDGGEAPFAIEHPLGAAMLVRAAALRQVDFFDERYWLYAEEVDLCYRLRQAGWAIWQVPPATMIHVGGASAGQFRARSFLALQRSRLRFFRRFYSAGFVRWHARLMRLAALRTLVGCALGLPRRMLTSDGAAAAGTPKERMLAAGELLHLAQEAARDNERQRVWPARQPSRSRSGRRGW